MKNVSINLIQNKQTIVPSFRAVKVPFKYTPTITKDAFKTLSLATGALVTAAISMNKAEKKESLPTAEEFIEIITSMTKSDGTIRFNTDKEYWFSVFQKLYKQNPELTWRVINLKSNDGNWLQGAYDICHTVKNYSLHPEFSEKVFAEVQTLDRRKAQELVKYSEIQNDNQELLEKFYNTRSKMFETPIIGHYQVNEVINCYNENPEFCERMLGMKTKNGEYAYWGNSLLNIFPLYKEEPELLLELLELEEDSDSKLSDTQIKRIFSLEKEQRDFYIKLLKMEDMNGKRFGFVNVDCLDEMREKQPQIIDRLLEMKNLSGEYTCNMKLIRRISEIEDEKQQAFVTNIIEKGVKPEVAFELSKSPYLREITALIDAGVSIIEIKQIIAKDNVEESVKEALNKTSPLKEFFSSTDYFEQIRKNSAGKYQKELIEFFDIEKMPYELKASLFNSDLSVEDFLSSLKKISKSSFKLAYDTPNQYLDGLDTSLSTPVNGHYPRLSDERLVIERQKVNKFFIENMYPLMRILKYVDTDTVNHLMDKRFNIFKDELMVINNASDDLMTIFNKLLQCKSEATGKQLSVKEKMQLFGIIKVFSTAELDTSCLEKTIEKGSINIEGLKDYIYNEVLKTVGANIDIEQLDKSKRFNEEFVHLVFTPNPIDTMTANETATIEEEITRQIKSARTSEDEIKKIKRNLEEDLSALDATSTRARKALINLLKAFEDIQAYSNDEIFELYKKAYIAFYNEGKGIDDIYTLVREASIGDFKEFIKNPNNKFGKANIKTEKIFKDKGLSYEQWLSPDVADVDFSVAGRDLKIKIWDRNPQEDLFMGNKTSCCTAIGRANGGSTPVYIMGTCWNVVQLFDEKGEVVGMSRVFIGEKDGECAVMMDNIELNNNLTANMSAKEKRKIRDNFFKYMHSYAQKITGKTDAKVFFYTGDTHVPTDELERVESEVDFVGENPTDSIYINSYGLRWGDPKEFKEYKSSWFIVPKK